MKVRIFNYIVSIDKIKEHRKDTETIKKKIENTEFAEEFIFNSLGEKKMNEDYEVLDVARYVINYFINHEHSSEGELTNLKLQKLLYYIQAYFLVDKKTKCFKENIINWRLGPIVREAYDEYKIYGNAEISDLQENIQVLTRNNRGKLELVKEKFDPQKKIKNDDIDRINRILETYLNTSAYDLVNRTHKEGPWTNSKRNDVISQEIILTYFETNRNRLLGG